MSYWGGGYPPYVSVAEKKAKAARKRAKLMKKNPDIKPVILRGSTIARTWWGKAWNENLERYADYHNRVERGRSYVRHEAVLDLQITPGEVKTLIQGSRSSPYSVVIKIQGINKNAWKKIKTACEGELESLQELLLGKFPRAIGEIFMTRGAGLFPSPNEINFSCSCPDWADMCKHVAASLYGIGARLDEDPSLFFKLRNVEIADLITQAVADKTKKLLKKAKKKSAKALDDSRLSELFGIEMEQDISFKPAKKKPKAKLRAKKAPVKSSTSTKKKRAKVMAKPLKTKTGGKKAATKKSTNKTKTVGKTKKNATKKTGIKKARSKVSRKKTAKKKC